MTAPLVSLESASKLYRSGETSIQALAPVDFLVHSGDFCVVTGRSGSGKSTLLALLGGLTEPSAGRVIFDGQPLNDLTDDERARTRAERIGFVFQFAGLLPTLTVYDNVRLPTLFGLPPTDATHLRARELLRRVGLGDRLGAWPDQLSGGEQRRVAIARSLLGQPTLLLADEPTGDLDDQTEAEIMDLFAELQSQGATIVMVTHNLQLRERGTRWIEMTDGQISEHSR